MRFVIIFNKVLCMYVCHTVRKRWLIFPALHAATLCEMPFGPSQSLQSVFQNVAPPLFVGPQQRSSKLHIA